jgi:hypothetical protein
MQYIYLFFFHFWMLVHFSFFRLIESLIFMFFIQNMIIFNLSSVLLFGKFLLAWKIPPKRTFYHWVINGSQIVFSQLFIFLCFFSCESVFYVDSRNNDLEFLYRRRKFDCTSTFNNQVIYRNHLL